MNTVNETIQSNEEISIIDILEFIKKYRRWFITSIISSIILSITIGIIYNSFLGKYRADILLINHSFDFSTWKDIKNSIPVLASELDKISNQETYKPFENEKFWDKNIKLNLSLDKSDIKNLVNTTLPNADNVTSINVNYFNHNPSLAVDKLKLVINLIRYDGEYFQSKSLLQSYQQHIIDETALINKNKEGHYLQLRYLETKKTSLELLKKQFPSNGVFLNNQVIDPKDSAAKFLPINTQLIAIINDINSLKLSQKQLEDEVKQLEVFKEFVRQSTPTLKPDPNLSSPIVILQNNLNNIKKQFPDELNSNIAISQIEADLTSITSKYRFGLQESFIKVTSPSFKLISLVLFLILVFFSFLAALLHNSLVKNSSVKTL